MTLEEIEKFANSKITWDLNRFQKEIDILNENISYNTINLINELKKYSIYLDEDELCQLYNKFKFIFLKRDIYQFILKWYEEGIKNNPDKKEDYDNVIENITDDEIVNSTTNILNEVEDVIDNQFLFMQGHLEEKLNGQNIKLC